jgi:hypothetical protein
MGSYTYEAKLNGTSIYANPLVPNFDFDYVFASDASIPTITFPFIPAPQTAQFSNIFESGNHWQITELSAGAPSNSNGWFVFWVGWRKIGYNVWSNDAEIIATNFRPFTTSPYPYTISLNVNNSI